MRVDATYALHRAARQRQQVVDDRQLGLPHDRQVVFQQEVEVAMDAAAHRVLDRQDAVVGGRGVDGLEHVLEGTAGPQLGPGAHLTRRCLAERTRLPLIRNLHVCSKQKGHHPSSDDGPGFSRPLGAAIIRSG